jgi:hypothetical protein
MATNPRGELPFQHVNSGNKVYSTPADFRHMRNILRTCQLFEPHDCQVEGLCSALDGLDLLVTTATGTGKTGVLIMLMLVIRSIEISLPHAKRSRKILL